VSDTKMLTESYRPKTIDELFGQERAKRLVGSWLRTGRLPRSILIHGETSAGKTTLARIIGKAKLCDAPVKGNACGECKSCKAFDDETHPDYLEMNAAKDRGINDMRALSEKVSIRPLLGKAKIIVLDEAHMITDAGWQAMLKTLEEPPPHVIYMVLTTNPEKIKPTILGRCSKVALQGMTLEDCTALLVKVAKNTGLRKAGLEEKHLLKIAQTTGAHPRNALHALEQVYTLILDAEGVGQTIDSAVINGLIKDVAVTDVEALSGTIARGILEGKPGGALTRTADCWAEADTLLRKLTEIMRQAMLYSTSPKLMDSYYKDVVEGCSIFAYTEKGHPASLDARRTILDAYSCFTQLRIATANHAVPVNEVIGEAVARAALICQVFRKDNERASPAPTQRRQQPEPEEEPERAERPAKSKETREEDEDGKVLRHKKKQRSEARLPS